MSEDQLSIADDEVATKAASELFASVAGSGARVDTVSDDDIERKVKECVSIRWDWLFIGRGPGIRSVRRNLEAMQQ